MMISTISSGVKTIAPLELDFCQFKSTNVVNNMSKIQSFPSINVEMSIRKVILIMNTLHFLMLNPAEAP